MKTMIVLLALSWAWSGARAQDVPRPRVADVRAPGPTLRVSDTGDRVGLERVAIEARIVGALAETRMTLTFANTTARRLAGDLSVPLPPDATVSGYALDVAGRMVDGVVVAKGEARRVYEIETRKRVDPGLVEWTRGNVFSTRVFPIPPNGTRTVRLSWVAALDADGDDARYRLPLAFAEPLAELSVRVEVVGPEGAPTISGGGPVRLAFDERYVAEAKVMNQAVTQDVTVVLPHAGRHSQEVEQASDGTTYFNVRELVPPPSDLTALVPKRVRIVWDASRSRASSDHAGELAFLRRYLATVPGATFDLIVLRNVAAKPRTFADADALVATLAALDYDGGTQLGAIPAGPADLVLVFSDGLSTFGASEAPALGAPTWVVSSSTIAAHDALRRLAAKNGGTVVDLRREQDVAVIGRPVWSLLEVAVEDGSVRDVLPAGVEVGASAVSGVLDSDKATLRVSWGVPGRTEPSPVVKRYVIERAAATRGEALRFAWAQQKLAALMADPTRNAERIADLGQTHGIVTPGTSLLVLESLEQYLTHRVRPPASWPEMRRDWDAAIEERAVVARKTEGEHLDAVAAQWATEIAWYEQTFSRPPPKRVDAPKREAPIADPRCLVAIERLKEMTRGGIVESLEGGDPEPAPLAKPKPPEPQAPAGPRIVMTPWDPKTPWTTALKAAPPGQRAAVYREQRARFGGAPSFYLDVADFFLGVKDRAMALQVLSNVAELRLDDPALLRVLAHRLAQLGELGTAQTIFEEVLRLRPEEPQSHRDLALVMGERAQKTRGKQSRGAWQAALDELAQVVKRRWDRFEGIEIVALHELNAMWTRAKTTGAQWPLDPRFLRAMPLDVRIAMTWDVDATDMDLHVVEPTGEEAFFGRSLTQIGGRVSRDFTQGYGPEVYSLRRGLPGVYEVKTKFFGASAVQLIGAVTLQVDVFTNWGRPNEKRRSVTLRLTEPRQDFIVGRIAL